MGFFSSTNRSVAHPTSPSMDTGVPSRGVERPERDVYCLPQSSAEVKNQKSHASTPPVCLHGADMDNCDVQMTMINSYNKTN